MIPRESLNNKTMNKSIEQTVNEALKTLRLKEAANTSISKTALNYSNTAPNTPPGATPGKKLSSDVESLTKLISSNTSLINRMKTVNNGQEITEFLSFILNSINDRVSGVNKQKLRNIIDSRFK